MVLFLLYVKAELEGVKSISLRTEANISISVRNPLSDTEVREKVAFNLSETLEQEENAKEPPCHFALKWDGSKKRSTLTVLDEAETRTALKKKKLKGEFSYLAYTSENSDTFVPILAFECRGLEPYAFHFLGDEFTVESEGGSKFEADIDLSDGDWADYDEDNDAAVSLSGFETKIESL